MLEETKDEMPPEMSAPTGSDTDKVSQLKFEFEKNPYPFNKTKSFSDFDADVQEFLISKVNLDSGELPGIAFYEDSNCWFVATSRRVVWWKSKGSHYVRYHDLGKIECTEGPIVPKSCAHDQATVVDGRRFCKQCERSSPWFFLESMDGRSFFLRIEPNSASKLWNCFSLMHRLEQTHPI